MDLFFAVVPIVLLIYWMTKANALPSQKALPLVALLMYGIKLIYFSADPNEVNATVIQGLLSALIPLAIIAGAILLFKTMETVGAMDRIRAWLNEISDNSVAQLMIIGWAFSFMIEGASGFGTPAALAAPILVSLGLPAIRVATFCLILNTIPVSFGAVGTPTWYGFAPLTEMMDPVMKQAFLMEIGHKTVILHGVAACVLPLIALRLVVGWEQVKQNLIFVYLSTASCIVPYILIAQFSYEFPSLIAGMIGLGISILLAKFGIGLEARIKIETLPPTRGANTGLLKALFPLWGTVLILLLTRIPYLGIKGLISNSDKVVTYNLGWFGEYTMGSFESSLGSLGEFSINPALAMNLNTIFGTDIAWSFKLLYVPWLIPFGVISVITLLLYKQTPRAWLTPFKATALQMKNPTIALLGALVYVRLLMSGGEQASSAIIGQHLAEWTGASWTFFSAFLGALGSFFSGSGTVSNLTFGGIQYSIADTLGLSHTTILALQSVGGSMGNMVCINNIVAICSILGLQAAEGKLLRMNVIPLLVYGTLVGVTALLIL